MSCWHGTKSRENISLGASEGNLKQKPQFKRRQKRFFKLNDTKIRGTFKCVFCSFTGPYSHFSEHVKNLHGLEWLKCRNSKLSNEPGRAELKCKLCAFCTKTEIEFKNHVEQYHDAKFIEVFNSSKTSGLSNAKYVCSKCSWAFADRLVLENHIDTWHVYPMQSCL
jgi:hypothetical protein